MFVLLVFYYLFIYVLLFFVFYVYMFKLIMLFIIFYVFSFTRYYLFCYVFYCLCAIIVYFIMICR